MPGKNFYSPALGGVPIIGEPLAGVPVSGSTSIASGNALLASLMGGLAWSQRLYTNAELNALSVTPIVQVPGVTGAVLIPIYWCVEVYKTIASGGPSQTLRLRWNNLSGGAASLLTDLNTDLANARTFFTQGAFAGGNYTTTATAQISGKGLQVDGTTAGPFGGSNATMRVTLAYFQTPSGY